MEEKLRTLKDIGAKDYVLPTEFEKDLRLEAIKWIKEGEIIIPMNGRQIGSFFVEKDLIITGDYKDVVNEVLKYLANITEDELKEYHAPDLVSEGV